MEEHSSALPEDMLQWSAQRLAKYFEGEVISDYDGPI